MEATCDPQRQSGVSFRSPGLLLTAWGPRQQRPQAGPTLGHDSTSQSENLADGTSVGMASLCADLKATTSPDPDLKSLKKSIGYQKKERNTIL